MDNSKHDNFDKDYRYAKLAMTWYGWGSPVGLGLFLVCLGALLYLLHLAGQL